MNKTLQPCPFCGGEAELVESDYGMYMTGYAVYCNHCCTKAGVTGRLGEAYEWTPIYDTEAKAIAAWNQRVCTVEESDEELYLDIAHGLFDDLMTADKDKAELWARAWPELFGKDEDDGSDLV